MNRTALLIGIFILFIAPKLSGKDAPSVQLPETLNPNTSLNQQNPDYTCGKLHLMIDSTSFQRLETKPLPLWQKLFRSLKSGNVRYVLRRLKLWWKDFAKKGFRITRKLSKEELAQALFRTEDYRFNIDYEQPVGACFLRNSTGHIIGDLIWAEEKLVDVTYLFHPGSMVEEVKTMMDSSRLLALFSVSFLGENKLPVGLHTKNGTIVTNTFNPHWDGLMLINQKHLSVANLQTMKLIGCATQEQQNESNTNKAVATHIINLLNTQITALQLPLLVFNNKLLIDYRISTYRLRETRLLCMVQDTTGKNFHLLVNIRNPEYLSNVIYSLLGSFNKRNTSMLYALLLDVGSNDFLQIYNPGNQINRSFRGLIPIEKANNAIAFTYHEMAGEVELNIKN